MASQWLNGCVHSNIDGTDEQSRVHTTLDELANQLNSAQSYSYSTYGPDDHNWSPSPSYTDSGDKDYLYNFRDELETAHNNGEITVVDEDVWWILDAFESYGYGLSWTNFEIDLDGDGTRESHVNVARSLSMGNVWVDPDPNKLTTSMGMHEMGHLLGAEHNHGNYGFDSSGDINDVTPMASAYVRAIDTMQSDTCGAGSGKQVDTFCSGRPNETRYTYCGDCQYWCSHIWTLDQCAINKMSPQ